MPPNLGLTELAESQQEKEVVINDIFVEVDAAITEKLEVAVDDANEVTLLDDEFQRHVLFSIEDDSTAPTGAITVYVPAIRRGLFAVANEASQDATITISGQPETPPTVPSGNAAILICDGTNVLAVSSGTTGSGTYDVATFYGGTPGADELVIRFMVPRPFTLPEDLEGSQGYAVTAPSSQTDFDVRLNGVSVGTMRFAASANVATFISASGASPIAGDRLDVVAPATLNGIADIAFTLAGSR